MPNFYVDAEGLDLCGDDRLDLTEFSELCGRIPKRLLITGILVKLLRQQFSDPSKLFSKFLVDKVWTSEASTAKIAIDTVFRFNAALTENRPGVFVAPGNWKIERLGIDDRKMPIARESAHCVTYYENLCQGSHTLFCVAGESAEVELLADEVYKRLMNFGPVIRKVLNFKRFVVGDVGAPAILEEATENFVIPISIYYAVSNMWQVNDERYVGEELSQLFGNITDIDELTK